MGNFLSGDVNRLINSRGATCADVFIIYPLISEFLAPSFHREGHYAR